jgi:hypothetical protein
MRSITSPLRFRIWLKSRLNGLKVSVFQLKKLNNEIAIIIDK